MESIKISQLPEMTSPTDNDVLAGVDISENETNKIQLSTLKTYTNSQQDTKIQQLENKTQEHDTKITTLTEKTDELTTKTETNTTDIKNLSNRTKRIETDIFDSGEATGTGINLQDSTLAEFQEVKIDGVGNQETTIGKNMYDYRGVSSSNGLNASLNEDGSITVKGTPTKDYIAIVNSKYYDDYLEDGETYTISQSSPGFVYIQINAEKIDGSGTTYITSSNSSTLKEKNFVVDKSVYRYKISIQTATMANLGDNVNFTSSFQLEKGAKATEFEKYTGGEPSPSPDYEQPIEVIEEDFELVSCGKNILQLAFDTITQKGVTVTKTSDGKITINGTAEAGTTFLLKRNIKLSKGTYTHSINNIKRGIYFSFSQDENTTLNGAQLNDKRTFVLNDDKIYKTYDLYIDANTSFDNETFELMLENSPDKTSFEPYTETRQTITMPEGEFAGKIDDTYKDQFRINYNEEDGKYHLYLDKKVGRDIFNGSENWTRTIADELFRYYTNLTKIAKARNGERGFCVSNYFIYNGDYPTDKIGTIFAYTRDNTCFIYPKEQDSVEQFKQWLQTHNTEVYYVLAEPHTLDLGVVNMPLSYYPITNVYNTCEAIPNMYVKYYRDFKGTIKTMQVDIENLKEAVSTLTSSQTSMDNDISTLQNVVSSSLEETESEVTNDDHLQGQ